MQGCPPPPTATPSATLAPEASPVPDQAEILPTETIGLPYPLKHPLSFSFVRVADGWRIRHPSARGTHYTNPKAAPIARLHHGGLSGEVARGGGGGIGQCGHRTAPPPRPK